MSQDSQDTYEARDMDSRRPEDEPGTGVVHAFGRQLKLFRIRAGLERPELGERTGYSAATIAAFEQGRRIPSPKFIDQADELLGAGGVLEAMKKEVARAQYPAFFRDAASLEAEAVELAVYATQAIPGLLQTKEYTEALLSTRRPLLSQEVIEQRVAARIARHEIFARWPAPLISFVIDEAVLRRPLGGNAVYRGALERVLLIGQQRNVEIQMMPIDREDYGGVDGPFSLITRRNGEQVVYLEVQGRSTLLTNDEEVRAITARYGIIRSQALDPRETLAHIEKLLGEV